MPQNRQYPPSNAKGAAGAYEQHSQTHTSSPRELEARVLLKAVRKFQQLQDKWAGVTPDELEEALRYNRQIWTMFVDTAMNNNEGHPIELRNNIANLGVFIFKHSVQIASAPAREKLDVLIDINREVAAGLMSNLQDKGETAAPDTHKRLSAET